MMKAITWADFHQFSLLMGGLTRGNAGFDQGQFFSQVCSLFLQHYVTWQKTLSMEQAKGYKNRVAGYFNAILCCVRRRLHSLFVPEVVEVEFVEGKNHSAYTYKVIGKE
jgi:hypothetical protein